MLLLREGDPWELLLVRRPGGADFAPGAYVFPGGTVHADDSAWPNEIQAAAVRELFEEVGILLARSGRRFARDRECRAIRDRLAQGMQLSAALRDAGLEPAFDRLAMFARWVTPSALSRRYDARFFFARLPAGQTVTPQEGEVVDWMWISPERALADARVTLVYATRAVLESIGSVEPVSKLIARARRLRQVPVVEPRMVQTESGWSIER